MKWSNALRKLCLSGLLFSPSYNVFSCILQLITFFCVFPFISVGASRTLVAMAQQGQTPAILGYVDREGRPLFAIILSLAFGAIAYINGTESSDVVFNWLLAISGLSTIFAWGSICWAHIRFRAAWKAQGHTLEELPFKAAFGVIGSWWGLIFNGMVLVAQFYISVWPIGVSATVSSFFQSYLAFPIVILSYVVWKLWKRTPFMVVSGGSKEGMWLFHTENMDLDIGRRDMDLAAILVEERAAHAALPLWIRLYRSLCGWMSCVFGISFPISFPISLKTLFESQVWKKWECEGPSEIIDTPFPNENERFLHKLEIQLF